jgi:outer membrane lipoprotein-sorting protein
MKFIRTVSTGRLLATIVGLLLAIGAGTAIAVAAAGPGPIPTRIPLANAVHKALAAPAVTGITADISFTNRLIDASDFATDFKDPILQGATGRLWLSNNHQLRLELQSDNGDSQVVVNHNRFWISDPMSHQVYEGTLPARGKQGDTSDKGKSGSAADAIPTLAQIQSEINKLSQHTNVSGAQPTDVAGRPTYTVSVSPKHDGGLLGQAQLAWDAVKGIPLRFAIYAKNDSTPVIELTATNISYGSVPASVFNISPPAGDKVVKISTPQAAAASSALHKANAKARAKARQHRQISGLSAVESHLSFKPSAPKTLVGLPRRGVELLNMGDKPAALVTYGQNLGGIVVIEQAATAGQAGKVRIPTGQSSGLSLPSVSINGVSGQELDTALGSMVRFTRDGVAYTVIGSVPSAAADAAARGL